MMDNRVYKLSTPPARSTGHLVTGVYPHDNKVSQDGRRLYNTSLGALASLPRSASSPPLTETPGLSLPVDDRRRRDAESHATA